MTDILKYVAIAVCLSVGGATIVCAAIAYLNNRDRLRRKMNGL